MAVKRPNPKKDKSARRRRVGPGSVRGTVLTAQGLADGVALAEGLWIRLVRAGEAEVTRQLITSVGSGVEMEPAMVAALHLPGHRVTRCH